MKKIEALNLLLEKVEDKLSNKIDFADGEYCEGDGECTCVIGQLLLIGGATIEQLQQLDDKTFYKYYGIRDIISQINEMGEDPGFVKEILEKLGFNFSDIDFLGKAQGMNDDRDFKELKGHILSEIKKEEILGDSL